MGVRPDPAGLKGLPVSGPPPVPVIMNHPVTRNVKTIFIGGRSNRTVIQGIGRRLHVFDCFLPCRGPKSWRPLPAVIHLSPVPGNPLPPRRRHAPKTAHPKIILLLRVPGPITGYPYHIGSVKFLLGWFFRNRIRRWFGNSGFRVYSGFRRLSERLVDRASGLDVYPRLWHRSVLGKDNASAQT